MPAQSKFTPETAKAIVDQVRLGNFRMTAAKAAGIDQKTLREWLHKADKCRDGHPLKDFARALKRAEAQAESRDIALIGAAGKEDWRALAWRRERMQPRKYGLRVRVEVERELEAMLTKLQRHLSAEVYERVLQALADDDDAEGDVAALATGETEARGALENDVFDAE